MRSCSNRLLVTKKGPGESLPILAQGGLVANGTSAEYAYRDGGIDAVRPRPQSGRPRKLTASEEIKLRERVLAGPSEQDAVCSLRGPDIRWIISSEFGVHYSLPAVYVCPA